MLAMQLPRCNARPLMSQLVYNTVDHISSKSPILCHDAYHHFILEEDWDEMTVNEPKGGNRTCKIPGCGAEYAKLYHSDLSAPGFED